MSNSEIKNHEIDESSPVHDENINSSSENTWEDTCSHSKADSPHDSEENTAEELAKESKHSSQLDTFKHEIESLSQPEAKINHALAFMEASLSQSGTPHFKSFWEVRAICLQLFKENLPPAARTQYWAKYSELSKEARRLKEMLDEQSSFAAEQIEMAISALEGDIAQFNEQLERYPLPDLGIMPKALLKHEAHYQDLQKKLNLLNLQASRINALRKELIKTEMRVRQKNKFFQRLSLAGDHIFPLRKDLIKEISSTFSDDVDIFIKDNFSEDFQNSLFVLREEIKGLQGIAKLLTLNTHAFTHTRMRLSEYWDKIKVAEKDRKKEIAQLKAVFKESFDLVQGKIQEYKAQQESAPLTDDQAIKQLDEISKFMRQVQLGREDIKTLRDQLYAEKELVLDKQKAQEHQRHQHEQEKEKIRKAKVDELKAAIDQLVKIVRSLDAQELKASRDELNEKIQNTSLNKFEKQEIERLYKPLRGTITDLLSDKEEQALLSLSDDERQSIEQLKEVLKQRKERRVEIKNQLESLRKASGSSGFDFEKAMSNNEMINLEKERLDKINQGIKEIEDKIAQLQKRK